MTSLTYERGVVKLPTRRGLSFRRAGDRLWLNYSGGEKRWYNAFPGKRGER
ncbi:hypothetical protein [Nocardia sp. NPDC005745]|uniref:hypothetical protein n=1 Tax=Nocardia sp. NPDC005745 TaxID=3157061 RepID=UPI0033E1493E